MASRQLLDAVIFHRANVEGLAAIASTQMGSKGPESAKEVQDVEQGSDEEAPGEDKGPSQAPTYLSLLFKVLLGCCLLFTCRVFLHVVHDLESVQGLLAPCDVLKPTVATKTRKCHCGN